jgi:thiol:disulfide interchange protein
MEAVKRFFGVLMLGMVGWWLVSPVLPAAASNDPAGPRCLLGYGMRIC